MAAAHMAQSTGTTLSEIFHIEPKLLVEKFRLLPQRCDPEDKDNLVFLSPSILLEHLELEKLHLELREGGWKDWGAKKVLGLLAHDILANKDYRLMQVPEITYFHMGYGKNSKNKNHMAVTKSEAEAWMKLFDLTKWKARLPPVAAGDDSDAFAAAGTAAAADDEPVDEPMDIDCLLPTQEQIQAVGLEEDTDDVISDPKDSGLKIPVKSRYLLFFSILLIFFKKRLGKKLANEATIGENKISDVLLFWTLPYLLNFTEQQVKIVKKHHEVASKKCGTPKLPVATIKKSTKDIIEAAFQACDVSAQLRRTLIDKYEEYYGESLEREYELPAVSVKPVGIIEPIILVPLCHQVTNMPVEIDDIGREWERIGKVSLIDDFLNIFISKGSIQKDYFYDGIRELEEKEKFATDYGILFPDEATFTKFIKKVEDRQHSHFLHLKCMKKQGRDFLTPRLGLVKSEENNLSVCFSYFQGHPDGKNVATLFRIIGAHRLNHVTLAVLHGACVNPCDPTCKLMNLHPVTSSVKFEYKGGRLRRCKLSKEKKEASGEEFLIGQFCQLEFPETFQTWIQETRNDDAIKKAVLRSNGKLDYPLFKHEYPLKVAFIQRKDTDKLRNNVLGAAVAPISLNQDTESRVREMEKYQVRAANLQGCLLHMIARSGCKGNLAVVLAIGDTLEPNGCGLPLVPEAMKNIISYFIMAVVVAGLPKVYPAEGSSAERDVEAGTDDEDSDSEENDDDTLGPPSTFGTSAAATPLKEGIPSNDELEKLSIYVAEKWKPLGRRLEIDEGLLTGFNKENDEYREKAYKMLLHWKQGGGNAATYQVLYAALCHEFVSQRILAEKICRE